MRGSVEVLQSLRCRFNRGGDSGQLVAYKSLELMGDIQQKGYLLPDGICAN